MNIRLVAASMALLLLCGYGIILFKSPIPYDVVDRDNSGIVSILEALDSLDIGEREIILNSRNCIEYYWLKDGLPAHTNCTQS
ncbi:hypothetical protein [Pelagibaculum spongiae]|uniref:Uncharacterized protein n=1 Tax=Pelagibaculum spongiae TaxID=2080658 RepID=A0A2V1GU66_9GAMM|nr:hypothetical protein [Pelagibaculum spongiae]PVZ68860.1 hypothetical protein DC094_11440 [Pelagibaculum spongiae]